MILSIESSCDDSSISITRVDTLELVYHKKISQELEHSIYGGVVPELAARLHAEALPKILEECKEYFSSLKAIAVTNAPGLSVTLTEGVAMAKALSNSISERSDLILQDGYLYDEGFYGSIVIRDGGEGPV